MNRFAAVRAAGNCNLPFSETKAVGGPRSNQRNRLKRLAGRANVSFRARRTQRRDHATIAIDSDQMSAMTRLDKRAAPDFDQ